MSIKLKLKQLFCKHKDNDVVCWQWTHGASNNEYGHIVAQLECKRCGRLYFAFEKDRRFCDEFASVFSDKYGVARQ